MKALQLILAAVLLAHGATAAQMDKVLLKDGSMVNGKITVDDGKSITVEDVWRKKTVLPYEDIDARTLFRLKLGQTKRHDGPGQFSLASFACDVGLWAQSKKHYGWALRADKSLESEVDAGLARLRKTAGESFLAQAKQAAKRGNVPKAEQLLTTIINELPNEPVAKEAGKVLASLHPKTVEMDLEEYRAKVTPRLQKILAPARLHYDAMVKSRQLGEANLVHGDKSIPHFQSALTSGTKARNTWRGIRNRNATDKEVRDVTAFIDQTLDQQLVEIYVHLAGIYLNRQKFPQATQQITKALQIDPKDGRANALKMKIDYNTKRKKAYDNARKAEARERAIDELYLSSGWGGYGVWRRVQYRNQNR